MDYKISLVEAGVAGQSDMEKANKTKTYIEIASCGLIMGKNGQDAVL